MTFSSTNALYFLHIPKTAGTSFIGLLHDQYTASNICPAYLWRDLLKIPHTQRSTYRLYRGHFYAYLDREIHQPLSVITFLRDPIERSLSHYAHILREPGHYFHKRAHELGSLQAFLRDPFTHPLITNFQTRALSCNLDPAAIASKLSPESLDALELERQLETFMPATLPDHELLRRAKNYLDRCLFVGLVEHFAISAKHIADILKWKNVKQLRLNQSPNRMWRQNLDTTTLAVLEEHTHLDAELYAYAMIRFEKLVSGREDSIRNHSP